MTRAQLFGVLIGMTVVAFFTVLRANDPQVLRQARDVTFDEYQRIAPRQFEPMPVKIVDIDEASLRELGQWPWPRDRLAKLTNRLQEMGAAAIAFDVLFAEPDRLSPRTVVRDVGGVDPSFIATLPDNDEIFAEAIRDKPVVLGFGLTNEGSYLPPVKAGFAFTGENAMEAPPRLRAATPIRPQLEASAAALGHISLNPGSSSAVVRTAPLFLSHGQQFYPSLAMEALRIAQGASTYVLAAAPDVANTLTAVKIGDFVVPLMATGEIWLYVTPDTSDRYISARRILADGEPSPDVRAGIEGSIVFIGTSAAGLQDVRTTALGQNVPGVSIHAQIVEQILSGHYLARPDWADGLEILSIALAGTLLVLLTTFVSPIVALVCGLAVTALALVASWLAFYYGGRLFDPLAPILAASITHFSATAFRFLVTDRERREVRQAFGRYLSPSLLYRIEHTRNALSLGGDDRELTVMFVDVRSFTEMSERMTPTEVVAFLNTLLDALSRHVLANEGTLDKFIGDSIMAFWNAPVDVANHPQKAVRAALGMRETLTRLNADNAFGFGSEHEVRIGIGIHTGLACVGNMGAETRFNYSAVGDTVNIAARIEAACKDVNVDILVSEATAQALPDHAMLDAGALGLKGKTTRTRVFAVAGDESLAAAPAFQELRVLHDRLVLALRSQSQTSRGIVNAAKLKAAALSPALAGLYARIGRRADHFAQATDESAKRPAE